MRGQGRLSYGVVLVEVPTSPSPVAGIGLSRVNNLAAGEGYGRYVPVSALGHEPARLGRTVHRPAA